MVIEWATSRVAGTHHYLGAPRAARQHPPACPRATAVPEFRPFRAVQNLRQAPQIWWSPECRQHPPESEHRIGPERSGHQVSHRHPYGVSVPTANIPRQTSPDRHAYSVSPQKDTRRSSQKDLVPVWNEPPTYVPARFHQSGVLFHQPGQAHAFCPIVSSVRRKPMREPQLQELTDLTLPVLDRHRFTAYRSRSRATRSQPDLSLGFPCRPVAKYHHYFRKWQARTPQQGQE